MSHETLFVFPVVVIPIAIICGVVFDMIHTNAVFKERTKLIGMIGEHNRKVIKERLYNDVLDYGEVIGPAEDMLGPRSWHKWSFHSLYPNLYRDYPQLLKYEKSCDHGQCV